jgi:hypothetical protein
MAFMQGAQIEQLPMIRAVYRDSSFWAQSKVLLSTQRTKMDKEL